jgi:hypothetical protein
VEAFEVHKYAAVRGTLNRLSVQTLRIQSDSSERSVVAYGWAALMDKPTIPVQIAVAVNGEIVAVTTPGRPRPNVAKYFQDRKLLHSRWVASFSSEKLRERENTITAYVVLDAIEKKLAILNAKNNKIEVTRE